MDRVLAILDAAEEILREDGYPAATLKAVGERAGVPTASVYHYFADRHQVDAELLRRHIAMMDHRISTRLDGPAVISSIAEGVDAVMEPMVEHFRQHPSCVELWFAGRTQELVDLVDELDQATAEKGWRLLVDRGLLREDTPLEVMRLTFAAANRLFDLAFQRARSGDAETLAEARRMAIAYLGTYAPLPPTDPAGGHTT